MKQTLRGYALFTAAAVALAGCGAPTPEANVQAAAPGATVGPVAAQTAAPPPPAHSWTYREGQDYGYPSAISEDQQKAGLSAGEVLMFRYFGEKNGIYTVGMVSNGAVIRASCANPCEVVKMQGGTITQRMQFNPDSLVGSALTDAFNGQLQVYKPKVAAATDGDDADSQ